MIADSAAGYAANTLTPADTSVLTVEYKLNLVAPADGERLVARGEVVKPGRTLIITKAEVFAIRRRKMDAVCVDATDHHGHARQEGACRLSALAA